MKNGDNVALVKRISELQGKKKYNEAIIEAEKAILKYPNDFKIVYSSGVLYNLAGIELTNEKYSYRCIELLEHSIKLLSQNTDPTIGELSIQNLIAQCYLNLGKHKEAVDLLKKYNVGGSNNALIALSLINYDIEDYKIEEAVPFLDDSFVAILTDIIRTMTSYANYYYKKKEYYSAREVLIWFINTLETMKIDKSLSSYVDKYIALYNSFCSYFSLLLGEYDKVEPYMKSAYQYAKLYDASPKINLENIKFIIGDMKKSTTYDSIGESTCVILEKLLEEEYKNEELKVIWRKIVSEE